MTFGFGEGVGGVDGEQWAQGIAEDNRRMNAVQQIEEVELALRLPGHNLCSFYDPDVQGILEGLKPTNARLRDLLEEFDKLDAQGV